MSWAAQGIAEWSSFAALGWICGLLLLAFVAGSLDVPVTLVGTGASRDAVLALQP